MLSTKQLSRVRQMLRVNQAGEIGANYIYKGQLDVIGHNDETLQHFWDQEKQHLAAFNKIIPLNRARPSALTPLWEASGYLLGAGSALMGRNAAMACTEAVETVIGQHYNDQIRQLLEIEAENPELKNSKDFQKLLQMIQQFRDQELQHKETAIDQDAQKAPGYNVLSFLIRSACRGAIKVAQRI